MSGGERDDDDGKNRASSAPGRKAPGDDSAEDDLQKLLAALRVTAKEDELAVARLPAEAFAPLSADDRARVANRIVQAQAAETQREKTSSGGAVVSMEGRRRRGRGIVAVALAPLAAAAALVLVVRSFSGEQMPPLPDYEISASGGSKELRGADPAAAAAAGLVAAPQRLRRESQLVAIARPAVAARGGVAVRAFVVQGRTVDEVWPQLQIAASGAVEIRAPVAEVFGDRKGRWELVVLVARAEALRKTEPAAAIAHPSDPTWRRLTVPLDFEGQF